MIMRKVEINGKGIVVVTLRQGKKESKGHGLTVAEATAKALIKLNK